MKKISFVIPAYNEERNIDVIYEKLRSIESFEKYESEFVFVNDGSKDNTMQKLNLLADKDKTVKVIHFSRNFGHQAALSAGMAYATGDAVITLDCDMQDPPELIDIMIEEWCKGYEIVYARRKNYRNDNFLKKILSKIYYKILDRLTSSNIPQNVGDFRLVDKKVNQVLNSMHEHSRYLRGMVAWTGFFAYLCRLYPPRSN
jgi:polyisoprenyl-phosphate glycosyltransferase